MLNTHALSSSRPCSTASVLGIDNSILVDKRDIQARRAKRGSGAAEIRRGYFSVPGGCPRGTREPEMMARI